MSLTAGSVYENVVFRDEVVDDASLARTQFSDCQFVRCRFFRVDLSGAMFSGCTFDHCDLSLSSVVNAGFRDATWVSSKLLGVDFTKCDAHFLRVCFTNCVIDTCNFSGMPLKKTSFAGSLVRETRFIETQLCEADFSGCDLDGAVFHQCDLSKANFTHAKNYAINPSVNMVKGATFSLPEAVSLLSGFEIELR